MRMTEKKKSRECSFRVFHLEKAMYKEGKLKPKYRDGMSKAEFRKRLLEDLKHE